MKKCKRLLALMMAVLLCFSLCGCDALDEMRAQQAFWQLDGSILLGETVYRPLTPCEEFSPNMSDGDYICVTDPDVPVLLSGIIGENFDISADGVFLENWSYGEDGRSAYYYCRDDKHEEIEQRIQTGFKAEVLCYEYEQYDIKEGYQGLARYTLTEEQAQAVKTVYSSAIPAPVEDGFFFDSDVSLPLYAASADHLFMRDAQLTVELAGKSYYLSVEQTDGTLLLYTVPVDMHATFGGILETYHKAMRTMEAYYEDPFDEEWL